MVRGPKTPEQKKRVKYAAYMRDIGMPLHITPRERDELVQHLTKLRDAGMSYAQIVASAPGSRAETAVAKILNNWTDATHRDVYNDLMQATYVRPVDLKSGSRIEPTGTLRRMRALVAAGFGYNILGPMLDCSLQAVFQLLTDGRPTVMSSTAERVADLYDELSMKDPFDYGATKLGVSRAKGVARRNNWAPAHCWDSDTIDDPEAIPQWTGECGTWIGARAHRRENIPMCEACRPVDAGLEVPGFSGTKLRELRERKGWSRVALAKEVGRMDASTIQYWETGRSVPEREWKIDRLLSVLDATFEDIIEEAP